MADILELLIEIQDQVIKCRRMAAELPYPRVAQRLYGLADEIEQRAREVDQERCAPR